MTERDLLFAATFLVTTATLVVLVWQLWRSRRDKDE